MTMPTTPIRLKQQAQASEYWHCVMCVFLCSLRIAFNYPRNE